MGPIDVDFRPLIWLAVVGLISIAIGVPVGLIWLWNHISLSLH